MVRRAGGGAGHWGTRVVRGPGGRLAVGRTLGGRLGSQLRRWSGEAVGGGTRRGSGAAVGQQFGGGGIAVRNFPQFFV